MTRRESLSEFVIPHRASSDKPPLAAAADVPISATTSRADSMAEVHGASADETGTSSEAKHEQQTSLQQCVLPIRLCDQCKHSWSAL